MKKVFSLVCSIFMLMISCDKEKETEKPIEQPKTFNYFQYKGEKYQLEKLYYFPVNSFI